MAGIAIYQANVEHVGQQYNLVYKRKGMAGAQGQGYERRW